MLGGLGNLLFGKQTGPSTTTVSNLTPQQQGLMDLGVQRANTFDTTYQGNAPDYFEQRYAQPMRQQYQSTLAGLQASPERHASSRRNQEYGAQQNYLSSLGQARASWLDQERQRQMQAAEAAKARQQGYWATGLNRDAQSTVVNPGSQGQGLLGMLGSVAGLASAGMGLYKGGQSSGLWGQGKPKPGVA